MGSEGLRVAFLGNDRWSVPSLEAMAGSEHAVVLVVTRSPGPGRRGSGPVPTPVAVAAGALGLPLLETDTVRAGGGLAALREVVPDVLAVVAYGEILPAEVLDLPRVAPVNVHFSLLPKLRGAAPVQQAILQGLRVTGVTTMRMDEGLDTGPILLQREVPIVPDEDAGALGERLARLGGSLLVETIDRLEAGRLEPTRQDEAGATHAPRLGSGDRWIVWARPAPEVVRQVRALSPDPGAVTRFRGRILKVLRARAEEPSHRADWEPAVIVEAGADGPLVEAEGQTFVRLLEVAPAGRKRMSGGDFARGFHPERGERLG